MSTQARATVRQRANEAKLDPMPIPAEWVLEGDPQASGTLLWKSADGRQANGIWECTPGTFEWTHTDETATVVAGRATVTPEAEAPMEVAAGDIAFFPEGAKTRWQVHETIRKSFHLHAAEGLPF
ncbi:MAG: cupin domain-containing protein [Chloroflexi bacterium]|nr:cupin domain-containing protein [Chloroflexota bacterium]